MRNSGAVAAGHPETVAAAKSMLEAGGNAFDAALAGFCAACVSEPVLASLGGGGFLLAHRPDGAPLLYDFFPQTPKRRLPPDDLDFFPILADFGTAQQEFHIGLGSVATPGAVRGLFAVHRDLCTLPLARIVEPAAAFARDGVRTNRFQAYLFTVVEKIYNHRPDSRALYGSRRRPGHTLQEGEVLVQRDLADTFEALAREGEALFVDGAIGARMAELCRTGGGNLAAEDLSGYAVVRRAPLSLDNGGATLLTNPPPSTGGILVCFGLELLRRIGLDGAPFGSTVHLSLLARIMAATGRARIDRRLHDPDATDGPEGLLAGPVLDAYQRHVLGRPAATRGTTHISVVDGTGNAASLTVSNGEGCGQIVPGTGIMLNNMLGEEDINPGGFHCWRPDTRMASMMAPSFVIGPGDRLIALGSGGSNRIRTAILQVLVNLLDYGMTVREAVDAPRLHLEGDLLSVEGGFEAAALRQLAAEFPAQEIWDDRNMFFGGVHAAVLDALNGPFLGAGDSRRGGVAAVL